MKYLLINILIFKIFPINLELSMQTRQLLLELICFYNCEENKIEKELESKWYKKVEKKLSLKTWKYVYNEKFLLL